MKKYLALLLALMFLTSCGSEQSSQSISDTYRMAPHISLEAEIRAEFSDRTDKYKVLYNYVKGNSATVKVLSPDTIAGIEATIDEESATLKFEDTILETGMDLNEPSPMNVLHKLVRVWSFVEPTQLGSQGENSLLVYDEGDYQYRTEFAKDLRPVCAEIMFNSRLKLKVDFTKCEGITNDN